MRSRSTFCSKLSSSHAFSLVSYSDHSNLNKGAISPTKLPLTINGLHDVHSTRLHLPSDLSISYGLAAGISIAFKCLISGRLGLLGHGFQGRIRPTDRTPSLRAAQQVGEYGLHNSGPLLKLALCAVERTTKHAPRAPVRSGVYRGQTDRPV